MSTNPSVSANHKGFKSIIYTYIKIEASSIKFYRKKFRIKSTWSVSGPNYNNCIEITSIMYGEESKGKFEVWWLNTSGLSTPGKGDVSGCRGDPSSQQGRPTMTSGVHLQHKNWYNTTTLCIWRIEFADDNLHGKKLAKKIMTIIETIFRMRSNLATILKNTYIHFPAHENSYSLITDLRLLNLSLHVSPSLTQQRRIYNYSRFTKNFTIIII